MTRNLVLFLLCAAGLGACGTPQERCISRNTDELRTVSLLLAEVEGNLARGYAWDERLVTHTEWDECERVVRDSDGKIITLTRPCLRDVTETERFRVPIDPVTEERKRANLAAKKKLLAGRAEQVVSACKAAFPE